MLSKMTIEQASYTIRTLNLSVVAGVKYSDGHLIFPEQYAKEIDALDFVGMSEHLITEINALATQKHEALLPVWKHLHLLTQYCHILRKNKREWTREDKKNAEKIESYLASVDNIWACAEKLKHSLPKDFKDNKHWT